MKNSVGLNEKALKIKVQGFFLFIFLFENNNRNDGEDYDRANYDK